MNNSCNCKVEINNNSYMLCLKCTKDIKGASWEYTICHKCPDSYSGHHCKLCDDACNKKVKGYMCGTCKACLKRQYQIYWGDNDDNDDDDDDDDDDEDNDVDDDNEKEKEKKNENENV